MEYRNLGGAGVKVSVLCLGTMTFGEADENSFMHGVGSSEAEAHAILDGALDAGINFVDTANVYGQEGLSERVIGDWFAKTGRRHDVVLATKFRFKMHDGPNGSGGSRHHLIQAVDDSLRRLQTDHIDLYQIHMQDLATPEEETLRALDDLVRAGKVRYIGCSNYAAYRLMDSLWTSRTQHLERYVTAQMQYHLLDRAIEREHVPLARRNNVGILPWSPLAGGFLTGKYRRDGEAPSDARLAVWKRTDQIGTEKNWEILEAVRAVAAEVEATPAQVALAWLLRKPAVTSVIIGARRRAHLDDNLGAVDVKLTDAHMARLDEVSAPEWGSLYTFLGRVQKDW